MKEKASKYKNLKTFRTFPLAGRDRRDEETGAAVPSEADVKKTKDWVDQNKK